MQGIWEGLLHHVVNEHEWLFDYRSGSNNYSHGQLTDQRDIEWLEKGSKPHQSLVKIVMDRRLQNNVHYFLNFRYYFFNSKGDVFGYRSICGSAKELLGGPCSRVVKVAIF